MGKSIKNEKQYKALLDKGMSKEKAARIANASSTKKHKNKAYEEWTKEELYKKAQEINIHGRSNMNKHELIQALRK